MKALIVYKMWNNVIELYKMSEFWRFGLFNVLRLTTILYNSGFRILKNVDSPFDFLRGGIVQ